MVEGDCCRMSELQEKLAKRRSQLTGMGLTPPAAPTEPAVTPAPVEANTHSSPDNWRDTPSVKLAEHMNMVRKMSLLPPNPRKRRRVRRIQGMWKQLR